MTEYTDAELLKVGKFVATLVGLKAFKTGMETGNLPKLADKYIRLFVREFAKNPDSIAYAGVGVMGATKGMLAEVNRPLGAVTAMTALKLCMSGNPLVSTPAALWLAGLGLEFLGVQLATLDEVKDAIVDVDVKILESAWDGWLLMMPAFRRPEAETAKAAFIASYKDADMTFSARNNLLSFFMSYIRSLYGGEEEP